MPGIGILLSLVLLALSGATLLSFVVALMLRDAQAIEAFGLLAIGYGTVAVFIFLVSSTKRPQFKRAGVFSGAIAMWFTFVFAAMPPFLVLENAHPAAAFFEASSAAITLGSTLVPINAMSTSMVFFRSIIAWLGGLLTLMLAVYVLGRYSVGGTPNRDLRFVLHGASRGNPRLGATFIEVVVPYAVMTLLCIVLLMLAQVSPVHAVLSAINTMSTNGFIGWTTAGSIFNNRLAELILMVFMLVGASSIIWQRTITSRQILHTRQQKESLVFLSFALVAVIVGIGLSHSTFPIQGRSLDTLLNRSFDIISTLTTTGVVHTPSIGIQVPIIFLIGLAFVGGTSYSTAGGLKLYRMLAMMRHSINEVMRLIYPSQFLPGSIDTDKSVFVTTKATWSAFFSAMILLVLSLAIFASLGHEFTAALTLAIGAFTSVGSFVSQSLFTVEGGGVPILSLIWVGLLGIAGRVELLVILAAFSRNRW